MIVCPSCKTRLGRTITKQGIVYGCPQCKGILASLSVLRKNNVSRQHINRAWQIARSSQAHHGRECPHCMNPMRETPLEIDDNDLLIDICPYCFYVWFDTGEFRKMPKEDVPSKAPAKSPGIQGARRYFAIDSLRPKKHYPGLPRSNAPDAGWKYIPGLLGLPVEMDTDNISSTPFATIATVLICIGIFIITASNISLVKQFGFYASNIFMNGGLNMLTAFFLHAGLWHLLGNMYFLYIFGNNVEDDLGPHRFALLLLASHVTGVLLHALFMSHVPVPLVGASAGISGVIAYYAVSFPRARIGFLFFYFFWIRIPAAMTIVLYLVYQSLGASIQVREASGVSYLAHLGGLIVGLTAGFYVKYHKKHWKANEI